MRSAVRRKALKERKVSCVWTAEPPSGGIAPHSPAGQPVPEWNARVTRSRTCRFDFPGNPRLVALAVANEIDWLVACLAALWSGHPVILLPREPFLVWGSPLLNSL